MAAEDVEYMETEDEFEKIPKFGNSKTSLDDVVSFYGYWESYSTKKSYAWLFPHNISEIKERKVLKIIDKEHKKIQQKARKERNDEIRSLVLFVKKRDKRMIEYRRLLEEKASQNRIKSQQNRLEQIQQRKQQIKEQQKNSKVHKEQEEALKRLEEDYFNQYNDNEYTESDNDDDDDDLEENMENCEIKSEDEEDIVDDELYCVACNKYFNSEKSKSNHDGSKKHRQNLELLKAEMNQDEENFQQNNGIDEDLIDEEEEEVEVIEKPKNKKSKKKSKTPIQLNESDKEEEKASIDLIPSDSDDDENWSKTNGNKKGKKAVKTDVSNKNNKKKNKVEEISLKEGKLEMKTSESLDNDNLIKTDNSQRCATCNQNFPSKNKLFTHLKATNHSIYLGQQASQSKISEKLKNKKKK